MANVLYPAFKQNLLDKKHDLNTDTIRACLIDSADYTYATTHAYLADVLSGARVATGPGASGGLASPTIVGGVFDSQDFTWNTVTGDQSENIILYNHDGNSAVADATRMLIAFYDTGMAGMPVTPNGGDVNVLVNAAGWFAL